MELVVAGADLAGGIDCDETVPGVLAAPRRWISAQGAGDNQAVRRRHLRDGGPAGRLAVEEVRRRRLGPDDSGDCLATLPGGKRQEALEVALGGLGVPFQGLRDGGLNDAQADVGD